MMKTSGILRDQHGRIWARFWNVETRYGGIVADWKDVEMPAEARAIFREFELRVSDQLFSMLEELERHIESFNLWVVWDADETVVKAWDVQVSEEKVSFKLFEHPSASETGPKGNEGHKNQPICETRRYDPVSPSTKAELALRAPRRFALPVTPQLPKVLDCGAPAPLSLALRRTITSLPFG